MPACRDCEWFDSDQAACKLVKPVVKRDWHEMDRGEKKRVDRSCKHAITRRLSPKLFGDVLEIGPGVRNLRRMVREAGATWYGLEPRWENRLQRLSKGTVGDMPFADNRFDWVICFEVIEHWHECGDSLDAGINEIHRVLKPGHTAVITAPFFYHGHEWFFEGRADLVRMLFTDTEMWDPVVFEEWRREYEPLPALEPWTTQRGHEKLEVFRDRPSAWRLEIQATKRVVEAEVTGK